MTSTLNYRDEAFACLGAADLRQRYEAHCQRHGLTPRSMARVDGKLKAA